jgi:predicted nucleic acid-binding protein
VKIYLDSGVFIDYLIGRAQAGAILREGPRRGRAPQQLLTDAETCFAALGNNHSAITSSLTCYEVEEAVYRALVRSPARIPGARQLLIASARATISQVLVTLKLFNIGLVDMSSDLVAALSQDTELLKRGVRAADALHVMTALAEGVDLFITTDARLAKLDGIFNNANRKPLRCLDTDAAVTFL